MHSACRLLAVVMNGTRLSAFDLTRNTLCARTNAPLTFAQTLAIGLTNAALLSCDACVRVQVPARG